MKISVIVAYHGEENYIRDCLDSLMQQNFNDIEVIIVCDGCSIPDISDYSKLSISVLDAKDKHGVAAVRNIGIRNAKGEYIFFLDADDYVEENTLSNLYDKAAESALVYSDLKHTWYSRKVYLDNGEELDRQNGTADKDEYDGDKGNPYEFFMKRAAGIQAITVLGMLIPRNIIYDNDILFNEEYVYYSDLPFLMKVLANTEKTVYVPDTLYIKRKHNDPINLPSLLQAKDAEKKIYESIDAYMDARKIMEQDKNADISFIDYKFVRRFVSNIATHMVNVNESKQKEIMEYVQNGLKCVSAETIASLHKLDGKLFAYGIKGNYKKVVKCTKNRTRKQTLKSICKNRTKLKRYLYENVFPKMKMLENTVMLESFFGKSYSDSPKYIFEYLNEKYPGKYKYVWVNAGQELNLPYKSKQVTRFSLKYFYYMARCKYHVFNGRQPQYFVKRKGNIFLETWHGTPLKKLVFDMDDVTTASPLYKEQFYIQTRSWDYLVAPNKFSEDIFRHAFMYDGKMLQTGYPRNDILYHPEKEKKMAEIKKELNIPAEKKVILYAPTWRDDEFYGHAKYKFTLQMDLAKMKEALGDEYVVILRTHYFIADQLDLSEFEGFAYNLSKYDDIARLYLISDILITDYSSVFFDYANLNRPMLFFTYDLEKYRSVLRGFYMDVEEELPGPMLFDTDEIIDAVKNIDDVQEKYKEKYDLFREKYCAWEDGHASEKVVEAVFNK